MCLSFQKLKYFLGSLRENRAATAIEFAILLFPTLLFVFGVIELGRLYAIEHELNRALSYLSRASIVASNSVGQVQCGDINSSLNDLTNKLNLELDGFIFLIKKDDVNLSVLADCVSGVPQLSINVNYQFDWIFPLIEGKSIMFQGETFTILTDF